MTIKYQIRLWCDVDMFTDFYNEGNYDGFDEDDEFDDYLNCEDEW